MKDLGPFGTEPGSVARICVRLATNPLFLSAVALYILGFVIWLIVLSKLELSFAYPILALSYCFVPFLSHRLFGEEVSPMRWVGVGIICFGVCVVGLSK